MRAIGHDVGVNASMRVRLCIIVAAVAAAVPASPARGQWWRSAWKARRIVAVENPKPTGLPGDDVAVVTMPTAGLTRPDGRDIRVVTPRGKLTPHRVLMTGPGDVIRIAFALRPGVTNYHIYFANRNPPDDAEELDIRRGVLQETWVLPGGRFGTLAQVRAVFKRAETLIGRGFRTRIFQGHNPFGPQQGLATIFTAYFVAPESGPYTFCTSSRNASFLIVDGKRVVSNGGRHRPQTTASKQGRVELTKGLHTLTFYHVSPDGNPIVVAAWQPPDGKRIWPMAPGAFAPVFGARAGALEEYDRAVTLDIAAVHAGEGFLAGRYIQRYTFTASAIGPVRTKPRWQWSFGDGTKGEGEKVDHAYLMPGEYTVTLTAQTHSGRRTRSMRLAVERPWDQVTQNKLDRLKDLVKIVAAYDFAALQTDSLGLAMVLFERTDKADLLLQAGQEFATRDSAAGEVVQRAMEPYVKALLAGGKADQAAEMLTAAAQMADSADARAMLLARAGRVRLDELGQVEAARELFDHVLERYGAKGSLAGVRGAHLGIGDIWRIQGDSAKARSEYEAATPAKATRPGQQAFRAGDFARHVEFYLRSGDLWAAREYLQRWADAMPADKLNGAWSLLMVKTLMLQGRHRAAAAEAETLVAVNPASPQGAVVLMLAANAYHRLGRAEKVVETLKTIIAMYPESTYAAEAIEKLNAP